MHRKTHDSPCRPGHQELWVIAACMNEEKTCFINLVRTIMLLISYRTLLSLVIKWKLSFWSDDPIIVIEALQISRAKLISNYVINYKNITATNEPFSRHVHFERLSKWTRLHTSPGFQPTEHKSLGVVFWLERDRATER